MRLTLSDVAKYVATLGVVDATHIYRGRLDEKKEKTVGIYNSKHGDPVQETIGGDANSSYGTMRVTLLVHWNKIPDQTETAATSLYDALKGCRNVTVNGKKILFTKMLTNDPINVDTDEKGIFERVIELRFYYERS